MATNFTQVLTFYSLILGCAICCVVSVQVDPATSRLCNSATRCNECLIANPDCVWCADPDYNSTVRCYVNGNSNFSCNSSFVQNPAGSSSERTAPPLGDTVQVSPTVVEVSVRPGKPVTFPLTVKPARNFPVDIYLLMDLSLSMDDDLENLKRLGAELAAAITNISLNFQMGFGSFVDKRVSPYVSEGEDEQENPCLNIIDPSNEYPDDCVSTYSYQHHVDLTSDRDFFNAQVQNQTISGNQDSPEGGFDGFLQSIVCTNLVGWRDVSRKLLIYITDAGFHIAGDGKLGGVVLPHDGLCKMNGTTAPVDYDDWITLDYPSIGQIAQALRVNDIIPIFAVEERAITVYQALVQELGEDNAFVSTLDVDSNNIVDLVRDSYNNISERIVFDRQQVPTGVAVDIQPVSCPGEVVNGVCTGVQIGEIATFEVSVTLQECTPENSGTTEIPIRVVGFGTFMIQLETICTCPCDDPANTVSDSSSCSLNGTLRCGHCDCNPGRFGDICQCDSTGQGGGMVTCPLGPTELECTGNDRGTCVCGECQCRRDLAGDPLFFGPACECDFKGCPSSNGELCSGRGACTCDGCRCNLESTTQRLYYGAACECTPLTDNCMDPNNSTAECNGRGTCGCRGTCECVDPYLGEFCELCSGNQICFDHTCSTNVPCAQCAVDLFDQFPMINNETIFFSNETLAMLPNGTTFAFHAPSSTYRFRLPSGYCPSECSPNVVVINGTDDVDYVIQNEISIRCEFVGECTYRYYVAINEETLEFTDVHVEFRRFCPISAVTTAPWIIAVATIAGLLVLGIVALIVIKLCLYITDTIELRNFEKELTKANCSAVDNPIYRSAREKYVNPAYEEKTSESSLSHN